MSRYQNVGSVTKRWIQRMVPTGFFIQVCVRREELHVWLALGGQVS